MNETNPTTVPFNRPSFQGKELAYIAEAIQNEQISGDGKFTHLSSKMLESTLGVNKCLLTSSCTDALEMSALLLNIEPGDEVIVPSFTFVSTANAFVLRGAVPRFVDVREDTLNLDENQLEKMINQKTKAVVPVHYAGVGCEMDKIMQICNAHKIPVVEDNAHGLFGKYRGKHLGTFGALATQSFHETKNFTCGEGGALLVNDPALVERAEILRDKGTNRKKFFRGFVDKYTWVDVGSSFLPSDILAAFLYAQLEGADVIQAKRQRIWNAYHEGLRDWCQRNGVRQPIIPAECDQAYHMYYIITPSNEWRAKLITHLKSKGVNSVFHYLPLHLSSMGQKFGGEVGDCPVTENYSERLLRLPFFTAMDMRQLELVISAMLSFKP